MPGVAKGPAVGRLISKGPISREPLRACGKMTGAGFEEVGLGSGLAFTMGQV